MFNMILVRLLKHPLAFKLSQLIAFGVHLHGPAEILAVHGVQLLVKIPILGSGGLRNFFTHSGNGSAKLRISDGKLLQPAAALLASRLIPHPLSHGAGARLNRDYLRAQNIGGFRIDEAACQHPLLIGRKGLSQVKRNVRLEQTNFKAPRRGDCRPWLAHC